MRLRLGGLVVAAVLVLGSCGVGHDTDDASPAPDPDRADLPAPELASVRDTLPPAPPAATTLTVLLTHAGAADDAGLDAAAAALAERPDIQVIVAITGAPGTATTMSGFPVTVVDAASATLLPGVAQATGIDPDLVVVGIGRTSTLGPAEPLAAAAAASGTPALVVGVEAGDQVDHAAAAMQLLEVFDLHLDALLDEPAAVHRLTVPSCRSGSLRGRLDVRATTAPTPLGPSACTTSDRSVPTDEAAAVGAGHVALSRLP